MVTRPGGSANESVNVACRSPQTILVRHLLMPWIGTMNRLHKGEVGEVWSGGQLKFLERIADPASHFTQITCRIKNGEITKHEWSRASARAMIATAFARESTSRRSGARLARAHLPWHSWFSTPTRRPRAFEAFEETESSLRLWRLNARHRCTVDTKANGRFVRRILGRAIFPDKWRSTGDETFSRFNPDLDRHNNVDWHGEVRVRTAATGKPLTTTKPGASREFRATDASAD